MAGKHRKDGEMDDVAAVATVDRLDEAGEPMVADGGPGEADRADSADLPASVMSGVVAPAALASVGLLPGPAPADSPLAPGAGAAGAVVVPGHGSARRAVREQRRHQVRRVQVVAGAVVLALAAAAVWFWVSSGPGTEATKAAVVGRSQQTLLLQIVDAHQGTVAAVLLAHDRTGQGTGFGALIPATMLVNAAGLGSVSLQQSSTAGGPAVGVGAVADAVGVTVDGGWQLSTTALGSLVDSVGGIDLAVDEDIDQTTGSGASVVLIPAGQQHLSGSQAATYATFLDAGGPEQQRLARLATVLQALLAKLPAAGPLAAAVTPLVTVADASVPAGQVDVLLDQLHADAVGGRLSFDNLPTHPLDIGGSTPALVVDNGALPAFVRSNFALSVPTSAAGAPFSALVQNGVGTPGLDEKARQRLAGAGISYIDGANASTFSNPTSTVLIADGGQSAQRQGAAVARALGLPASDVKITSQGQTLAAVVVILGDDFKP